MFAYGTGSIRGQVKVEGGDIPAAAMMFLNIRRAGTNQSLNMRTPTPDSRGRFVIDGLQPVRRMINTDEAGRFVADDLPRGSYAITAIRFQRASR